MNNIWRKSNFLIQKYGFDIACYLVIIGLLFSRALLSISTFLLVFTAFLSYKKNQTFAGTRFYFLIFLIIYCFYLTSFWNTLDYSNYFRIIFKNSTLFFIPLAFWLNPKINFKKHIINLFFYGNLLILIITSFKVLNHYNQSIEALKNSKNILTLLTQFPAEFSILAVIAFIIYFHQSIHQVKSLKKSIRLILLVIFFALLHFVALRFSLLLIYFFLFFYLITYFYQQKQKLVLVLFLLLIALCPILSYQFVDSFRSKANNTFKDFEVFISDKNPNDYSISQRAMAVRCATAAINKNIWFGVSPADAKNTMQSEYTKGPYLLTPENRVFVHNQFFLFALSFGLPITIFILVLLAYFSFISIKEDPFLVYIISAIFLYWMIENGLEKQISATAFLFFVFFLRSANTNHTQKNILS